MQKTAMKNFAIVHFSIVYILVSFPHAFSGNLVKINKMDAR